VLREAVLVVDGLGVLDTVLLLLGVLDAVLLLLGLLDLVLDRDIEIDGDIDRLTEIVGVTDDDADAGLVQRPLKLAAPTPQSCQLERAELQGCITTTVSEDPGWPESHAWKL
jgi:hypothetical protein